MDQTQSHPVEEATETERRPQWIKPGMARLDAGSAELGDVVSPDGNINS